jgi:tryptophan synthase beta chain
MTRKVRIKYKIMIKNKKGYFGQFGGQFVSELLYPALSTLEKSFELAIKDKKFIAEYLGLLKDFAGRPTPLYYGRNISKEVGCRVYFKREDLVHGGSHKMNNVLGQVLLAKYMGKTRIITETAAGMHGVATVMASNALGLKSEVYMGVKDIDRQKSNAQKIELLGGIIHPVTRGNGILKDAVSEALVEYIKTAPSTHYLIGSAVGPHPYPTIVSYFQKVIGMEIRKQILKKENRLPNVLIACGSGGSNAIGAFGAFLKDEDVELVFVEGGGTSLKGTHHAAAFTEGSVGIFQGTKTYLVQDKYGMDRKTESRSTGLNYPARGPEMSYLFEKGRVQAKFATDSEVLKAYRKVAQMEGILPAFETCHALAELFKRKGKHRKDDIVILNFSGRGDKDMETALALINI